MRGAPWVLVFAISVVVGSATSAEAVILINEILADPPAIGGDANRDGTVSSSQDEFVELLNTTSQPVSLAGWSLWDAVRTRHTFSTDAIISGLGLYVIFGGGSPQGFSVAAVSSQRGLALNNDGDTVNLFDPTGLLIDRVTYGPEGGMDTSLTRFPNGTSTFVRHNLISQEPFSPGAPSNPQRATAASPLPEPSTLALLGLGLIAHLRRRRTDG